MTGAAEWIGRVGSVWAQEHARTERAFAGIASVLDAAIATVAPAHGRALDIGCGIGSTALALAAARPGLRVTGVDLSEALIAVARERDPGSRVRFVEGDALDMLPGLAPLDLLVSRHGVMFFADPVSVFAALRVNATADAPLVFSCFRARGQNDWAASIDAALGITRPVASGYAPGPFAFADREVVTAILVQAGWRDVQVRSHDVDYVVGAGPDPVTEALAFYRRIGPAASVLAESAPQERQRLEQQIRDVMATRIRDGAVTFTAAIWVVSARAQKETP